MYGLYKEEKYDKVVEVHDFGKDKLKAGIVPYDVDTVLFSALARIVSVLHDVIPVAVPCHIDI